MALGRGDGEQQGQFWIPAEQMACEAGHLFYRKYN
jgi:hypothetical protein